MSSSIKLTPVNRRKAAIWRSFFAPVIYGYKALMNIIGVGFDFAQKLVGIRHMAYIFLIPNLAIFGMFTLIPVFLNGYYSFTGGDEPFLPDRAWVGSANYERILDCQDFGDPNSCHEDFFWRAVQNSIRFVLADVVAVLVLSMITALLLNRNIRGRGFFRSVFFYPVMLSPIVVALTWRWIITPDGLLNALLTDLGYESISFLTNANWSMFWVIFLHVWATMGFSTLILLAGLQGIPPEVYEASQIDGANAWEAYWNITFPLLMPTTIVVFILAVIHSVQVFDIVYAFTGGGPGTATKFIVQYIVETGFTTYPRDLGMAATASVFLGIALLFITLIQVWASRRAGGA